jgi:hypothetical protein
LTTPIGSEVQAATQDCTSSRSCSVRRQGRAKRARSSQINSELPPPISNTSVKSQLRSISDAQPDTASLASVSCVTISMGSPASRFARSMNSSRFPAMRHASVAISRERLTPRRFIFSAQTLSASMVRLIAGSDRRPEFTTPSPRRMIREKASMTRKPRREGLAMRSLQLLVPRSRAP